LRTWSAVLLLVGVLLVGSALESTELADAIPNFILDYDYSQNIKKFFDKANFVANYLVVNSYELIDVKNPTLLVLIVPLSCFIIIREETRKIKFYDIQRFASVVFIIILISPTITTTYTISTSYWGTAFGEELPIEEEPIEPTILNNTSIKQPGSDYTETFDERIILYDDTIIVPKYTEIFPQPPIIPQINHQTISFNETVILIDYSTESLTNYTVPVRIDSNLTISLYENLLFNGTIQQSGFPQNYSQVISESFSFTDGLQAIQNNTSQNYLFDGIKFLDELEILLNNHTIPPVIEEDPLKTQSKLFSNGLLFDILRINYIDGDLLPNATESWQFENDIDNVDLNGDAKIVSSEGINGTSLLLDGDLDFAQTNVTNATTYISDMSIAAWVKPNYTNGSPEFTVVSKGKSFVLSINSLVDPQRVAKFSVFDGIKWTTVESWSTIPDDSWSHITARFNKTVSEIYINGTLEGTVTHDGIPYISQRGQIELKTLQEITSYQDIVIGAALSTRMDSRPFNMFSGMIDGVELFDSRLESEDVMNLYLETIPIKTPPPEPIPYSRPSPSLQYRIVKGNETLPLSILVEDLNEDITELTVSTWIKPNFTGGSTEFTVLGKENSFALSLNKMSTPEEVAKFTVYDGISWHTVTGNTKVNGLTHVAAVFNQTNISLYVNGTLDGFLNMPIPIVPGSTTNVVPGSTTNVVPGSTTNVVPGSTTNVTIGAYENTLRGEQKQSNYYSGVIDEVTVWKYSMVDREIQEEFSNNAMLNNHTNYTLSSFLNVVNSSSYLVHSQIEIGKPVNWIQTVVLNDTDNVQNVLVELPADAQNIQIDKIHENGTATEISQEKMDIIQSIPTLESDKVERILLESVSMDKIDQVFQEDKDTKLIVINENATEYSLEFETPAPYTTEEDNSNEDMFNKTVTVAHDSALHYTDVKSYSDIPEDLDGKVAEFKLYWMINGSKVDVTQDTRFAVTLVDTNSNGIIDRMEWIVPQLSEQEFVIEGIIIEIIKASHLDANRELIEDIYTLVKARDGLWTDQIPDDNYVRITFEKNLTSINDITIYAKSNYSNSNVEVYEKDSDDLVANFGTISEDKKYQIFLTNLTETQNTFDLKIVGNPVEFDYIVDPLFNRPTNDTASVNDDLGATTTKPVNDSATIDDNVQWTLTRAIDDEATIDDTITITVTYNLKDEVKPIEDIVVKAPVTKVIGDEATIDDNVQWTLTRAIDDEATIDDNVQWTLTRAIDDEATIDDTITITVTYNLKDAILINNDLGATTSKPLKDETTIDDNIHWTLTRAINDQVQISHTISKVNSFSLMEEISISDFFGFEKSYFARLSEQVSTKDIPTVLGAITIETRDLDGNLIAGASYRITPNPFGGNTPYLVQDGILNDNDTKNDGKISVYYIPLDLYLVNRTGIALPPEPLYNFTHVTVHGTDINATGLFRVLDGANLLNANTTYGDTIDIRDPPGFDGLTSNNELAKVTNETQTLITKVNELPSAIFVGALNASAIQNGTESQYTLVYNNTTGLGPNELPVDIRDFFSLAPYDIGTNTDATIIGVLTATEETAAFGQYIATQPIAQFNCGQRYIFSLDDSLVPSYGGMKGVDFTLAKSGTCPTTQEDYITYEIASNPPSISNAPVLLGEHILLYLNVRFPGQTGEGVDFGDPANIDSYQFTIISNLPETNQTTDLTVYVNEGGSWNTTGVDILSRKMVSTGPNAGKVELIVSVDHTSQFVVGGKKIQPTQRISGSGPINVNVDSFGVNHGDSVPDKDKSIPILADVPEKSIDDIKPTIPVEPDVLQKVDEKDIPIKTELVMPEEKEPTLTKLDSPLNLLNVMIILVISLSISVAVAVILQHGRGILFG